MYYINFAVRLTVAYQLLMKYMKENMEGNMNRILTRDKKQVLEDVETILEHLEYLCEELNINNRSVLRKIREELESPFSIAFVGEYNRGKSSIINALLGKDILEVRNEPTTSAVYIVEYSQDVGKEKRIKINPYLYKIGFNADFLRDIRIVDTPGIRSLHEEHEKILRDYLPKADMVFFVLDVSQPLSKDEMALMEEIRKRYHIRHIVIILNKIDIVDEEELKQAEEYIKKSFYERWGFVPKMIKVSSKWERNKDPRSNFAELRRRIIEELSDDEKLKVKIERPIAIAREFYEEIKRVIGQHKGEVEEMLGKYKELKSKFDYHFGGIDRSLENALKELDEVIEKVKSEVEDYIDYTIGVWTFIKSVSPFSGNIKEKISKDLEVRIAPKLSKIDDLVDKLQLKYKYVLSEMRNELAELFGGEGGDKGRVGVTSELQMDIDRLRKDINKNLDNITEIIARFKQDTMLSLTSFSMSAVSGSGAMAVSASAISGTTLGMVLDAILLGVGFFSAAFAFYKLMKYKGNIKDKVGKKLGEIGNTIKEGLKETTKNLKSRIEKEIFIPIGESIHSAERKKRRL